MSKLWFPITVLKGSEYTALGKFCAVCALIVAVLLVGALILWAVVSPLDALIGLGSVAALAVVMGFIGFLVMMMEEP